MKRKRARVEIKKMDIGTQRIPPFDARHGGLRRAPCHGIDIHYGRKRASADFWNTPQGETLARFTRGDYRNHFLLVVSGQTGTALTCKQLEDAVHERLDVWFFDACDDSL